MSIQQDSGTLLVLLYDEKVRGRYPEYGHMSEKTKWPQHRLTLAISYLGDKGLIKAHTMAGLPWPNPAIVTYDVTPQGIDIVENKKDFKRTFGISVGLPGIFSLKFDATQK